MVYSIDIDPRQFMQIFSSAFGVQHPITAEQLNQINIVAYRWKEEILSFPMCVTQAKLSLVSNFKGRVTIVARHVSEKVR